MHKTQSTIVCMKKVDEDESHYTFNPFYRVVSLEYLNTVVRY